MWQRCCRLNHSIMEVSRTVSNFSQFKKEWFGFEIDWLLHKGVKKSDIAASLKTTNGVLSVALRRAPSDAFLDKFMKVYGMSITINRAYEGYGIFYIERNNILSAINYPDCRPMTEETRYRNFSDFKKAWLKMEMDNLKEKHILKKDIAKKLGRSQTYLSIYTSSTPSDNFVDKYCEVYNIQFTITKYSNNESMAINGKFSLNPSKEELQLKEKPDSSTLSQMYLKMAEEKYNLEQELKKKEKEIAELKWQIEKLQAKAGK